MLMSSGADAYLGQVHGPQLGLAALEEGDHRRVHLEESPAEVDEAHGDRRVVEQLAHHRLVAGTGELVRSDDRLVPDLSIPSPSSSWRPSTHDRGVLGRSHPPP